MAASRLHELSEHAALGPAAEDLLSDGPCRVRVVDPHRVGVDPEVDGLVPRRRDRREDDVAQTHAAVVESERDPHLRSGAARPLRRRPP